MRRTSHFATGFTLVELLVACAVSMLVLGAVAMMFGGTSGNRLDVERTGRLTENASFALELLSDDIRLAGYFAEARQAGVVWQVPNPCSTALTALGYSTTPLTLPAAIVGYRGADPTPSCITNRKTGTAAVVLRRLDISTTPAGSADGAAFWQSSSCAADASFHAYSNVHTAFTLRKLGCTAAADAHRVVVRAYYVSACNDCSKDSIPTLKRADLVGDTIVVTPLVEGVENMQIEYGFDTNGDGNADVYRDTLSGVAGAQDNNWFNVVSTRIYLLGRSTDAAPGYTDTTKRFYMGPAGYTTVTGDAYKRVQLSAMVRLNNVAGLREKP
jgi:type IV pilus assembly protein PilW